jgi:hypothetical protein
MKLPEVVYKPRFAITRASHVVIRVRDLQASRAFYVDLLGFVVSDERRDVIWLRGLEEGCHHRKCFSICNSCAAGKSRVTKPDDSSLDPEDLRAVEERARHLLDRASAWDRFPVPIDDVLAAANVRLAPTSLFDPVAILGYLRGKAAEAGTRIKSAIARCSAYMTRPRASFISTKHPSNPNPKRFS